MGYYQKQIENIVYTKLILMQNYIKMNQKEKKCILQIIVYIDNYPRLTRKAYCL